MARQNISIELGNYLNKSGYKSSEKSASWLAPLLSPGEGDDEESNGNGKVSRAKAKLLGLFGNKQNNSTPAPKEGTSFGLGKKQRILGFITFILMGTFCFVVAGFYLPVLPLKARKFSLLYTLGSLFFFFSFSVLWGFTEHFKHLFAKERFPFVTVYLSSMFATLYFALWVKSTLWTSLFAIIQAISLTWYLMNYIPGGQTALKFFSKVFVSTVKKTTSNALPV